MFKPHYDICPECGDKGLIVTKSRGLCLVCDKKWKDEKKKERKSGKDSLSKDNERRGSQEVQRSIRQSENRRYSRVSSTNQKYYKWAWERSEKKCEECRKKLKHYSASYVSHILSRGAYPELRDHPLNHNILCVKHHRQWESPIERKKMKIFPKNKKTILKLLKESQDKFKIKKL